MFLFLVWRLPKNMPSAAKCIYFNPKNDKLFIYAKPWNFLFSWWNFLQFHVRERLLFLILRGNVSYHLRSSSRRRRSTRSQPHTRTMGAGMNQLKGFMQYFGKTMWSSPQILSITEFWLILIVASKAKLDKISSLKTVYNSIITIGTQFSTWTINSTW